MRDKINNNRDRIANVICNEKIINVNLDDYSDFNNKLNNLRGNEK